MIEVFRSNQLSVRAACDYGSRACVITFDSYSDDRRLDRSGFGEEFFHRRSVDAIHFIGSENDWYQYAEMPEAAAAVADLSQRYERVVAYGSSMGGYAAIRFGGLAGAQVALAISPQFSIDPRVAGFERRWKNDSDRIDFSLERTLRAPFVDTAYIVYDPGDLDRRHAEMYRQHTKAVLVDIPDSGHPATGFLAEAGLLGEAVLDIAGGRFDASDLRRRAKAARKQTPQYYLIMSQRAKPLNQKLAFARQAAEMSPDNFGYLINYASLLAQAKRYTEAKEVFRRAETKAPNHPVLLAAVAEYHERRGELAEAIAVTETMVTLHSATYEPRLQQLRMSADEKTAGWPSEDTSAMLETRVWSRELATTMDDGAGGWTNSTEFWPRSEFFCGDDGIDSCPESLDATGYPRTLLRGPNVTLHPGKWRFDAEFELSADAARAPYAVTVSQGPNTAMGVLRPRGGGQYTISVEYVATSIERVDVRLVLARAAFHGAIHFHGVKVEYLGAATDMEPAGDAPEVI